MRLAELVETSIALAVSGGSDSIAMMRLALDQYSSKSIIVLTVDHGLRAAAAEEAHQVSIWCAQLGVRHETLKWFGPKPKTGIQAKARQARYDLMTAWCLQNQVPVLMTAHNADDQNETVYMRQTRTSSQKSLAGIWPERDWNGVRIVRPVLEFSRVQLRHYLSEIEQAWIDDPSNEDSSFERVRVRKILNGANLNLSEAAHVAQKSVRQHKLLATDWIAKNLQVHALGYATFERASFETLETEIQDFVLLYLLKLCGSASNCELRERLSIVDWFHIPNPSRRVLGGVMFAKRMRQIIVGREAGRISDNPVPIPESGELIWDQRFRVKGPVGAVVVAGLYGPSRPRNTEIPAFIQAGLPILLKNGDYLPFQDKLEFLRH